MRKSSRSAAGSTNGTAEVTVNATGGPVVLQALGNLEVGSYKCPQH